MERNHWIFPIIVISLVVIGLSVGAYFWYKRRQQKEEERKNVQYYSQLGATLQEGWQDNPNPLPNVYNGA